MLNELFDLHEKFENYISRCFFEMKMEISKRCIVLEEEVGKRIDKLIKAKGKKSGNTEGTCSKTSTNVSDCETSRSSIKMQNPEGC